MGQSAQAGRGAQTMQCEAQMGSSHSVMPSELAWHEVQWPCAWRSAWRRRFEQSWRGQSETETLDAEPTQPNLLATARVTAT